MVFVLIILGSYAVFRLKGSLREISSKEKYSFQRAEDAVTSHGLVHRTQFLYLCSSTVFRCTREKTV